MSTVSCFLCIKTYNTKKQLQNHERNKHKNNKIIPHHHILCQPSDETLSFYRDTVIIRLKSSLGFNRHAIGKKHITIDAFPESVYLFYLKMKTVLDMYLVNENTNVLLRVL